MRVRAGRGRVIVAAEETKLTHLPLWRTPSPRRYHCLLSSVLCAFKKSAHFWVPIFAFAPHLKKVIGILVCEVLDIQQESML